ncbi:UNVERIFIED_CONTAM: hypothetical protein RMT77_016526 [Armadillidium vulgare]
MYNMSNQFSDKKAPHGGGFQQSSDQSYNAQPYFNAFAFKEPDSRNLCDQQSERNIPTQNYRSLPSLSQLPPPPLPPPPPPPRLWGPNFSPGNLPSKCYSYPPLSNYPPLRPRSNTGTDFSVSLRQPNLQNPDYSKPPPPPPPKPPFSFPPQNLLLRQPVCEIKNQHQSTEGDQLTSTDKKMGDVNLKGLPEGSDDKDELYVQNWVSSVRKRLNAEESERKTKEIKVNDVQKKLLRYAILIKELKDLTQHVSDLPPPPDKVSQEYKERVMTKVNELKIDIEELRRYFSEEETLNKIKESLSKRREKRLKRRKTKSERNERWKRRKEEWKRLEEEIDEKIKIENEEEKQNLEEEKMKREADSVLREVRSKQEDVVRMQKLLQALTSLRDIRKNKGEMHGYVENPEASSFFDKMKKEFETILSDQQKIYCSEEQTLKIMIEESQSSTISVRKRRPLFAPNFNEIKRNICQIYFGKERPRIEEEKEYERSFLAAEESVEILVQRRKDWDQFLVGDNSGSSIPIGWVLPNLNPSNDWKSYQES